MARKKRVAWRKLNPRVHWKHQNWTCGRATLQGNSSNTPSGISELQEFLQRPLHLQTLPSCCSMESPAARRLLSHFITRKPDGPWQAGAVGELMLYSWTRAHSGTCQPGIMVVQSHGTCTERHFMQGLHFCNMAIFMITAQFWVFCTSTKHHTAEH